MYDQLIQVISDGLNAKTLVWLNCPSCKRRAQVEVQDTRSAIAAAEFVSAQALGRPGVAEGESEETERINFKRVVYLDESDAARVFVAAEKYVPAESLAAFRLEAALDGAS